MSTEYDPQHVIDHLISTGEAVEYGEPWTDKTTHEWWVDEQGERHSRLVMTYHGGGSWGDDDEAEYSQRLLDQNIAVQLDMDEGEVFDEEFKEVLRRVVPDRYTHVVVEGKAHRIRYYVAPPAEVIEHGSPTE